MAYNHTNQNEQSPSSAKKTLSKKLRPAKKLDMAMLQSDLGSAEYNGQCTADHNAMVVPAATCSPAGRQLQLPIRPQCTEEDQDQLSAEMEEVEMRPCRSGVKAIPKPAHLSFFSAKPKLLHSEQTSNIPSRPPHVNDSQSAGAYYAASQRKGPFMSVQEDRVSNHVMTYTRI